MENKIGLRSFVFTAAIAGSIALLAACQPKRHDDESGSSDSRYLYVASGLCYSGGNTTFTSATASNQVFRINLNSGQKDLTLADYTDSQSQAGDSPVAFVDADSEHMLILLENATAGSRRIEKIEKKLNGARQIFSNNTTALSASLRSMTKTSSGDLLISKSSGIELITSSNTRIGAPYINPTGAPCATSTTLISKTLTLDNGRPVFIHAAASQNRIGIYNTPGGTACQVAQAAPNVASFPTAMFYDSANHKLVVAYAGNTTATDINSIYAYDVSEGTVSPLVAATITNPVKIYDASLYQANYPYLLYGISEMTYDASTASVYIATATSTATTVANYKIEKFTYDASKIASDPDHVLTRVAPNGQPFYSYGIDTKCISKMAISN